MPSALERGARPRPGAVTPEPPPTLLGPFLVALLVATLAAVAYLTGSAAGPGYAWSGLPLDDVWIHQVYGRSVAQGRPFQYNPGEWEVGSTSPLWAFLLAPGHWLGAPVVYAKLIGVFFTVAGATVGARLARRFGGKAVAYGFAFSLPILPYFSFAAVSGMEVTLFCFLVLGVLERGTAGRWSTAGWLAGLAVLARPEGWILLPLLGLARFLADRAEPGENASGGAIARARGIPWGGLARTIGPVVLAAAPWVLFCLSVSGRPLPATVYAKSHWLGPSLGDQFALLATFLSRQPLSGSFVGGRAWELVGATVGLVLVLLGVWRVGRRAGSVGWVLVGGFPLLYIAGTIAAVPLGASLAEDRPGSILNFYFARYLIPALPLLLLLWLLGLGELVRRAAARWREARVGRVSALALGLVLLILPTLSTVAQQRRLIDVYSWNCRNIDEQQVAAGRWIAQHIPPGETICVSDAGAIRFFGEHRVLDLVGLNAHRLLPLLASLQGAPRDSPEQRRLQDQFWAQERPSSFAVTRGWHGPLLGGKRMQLLESIEIEHNTICAGSELVILQAVPPTP